LAAGSILVDSTQPLDVEFSSLEDRMIKLILKFADGRVETQELSTGRKVVQFLRRLKTVVSVEIR
jgi:hypothetical protein